MAYVVERTVFAQEQLAEDAQSSSHEQWLDIKARSTRRATDDSSAAPSFSASAIQPAASLEDCHRWVSAVALGDRVAFSHLFNHYAPRVKGYLVRSGTQVSIAEDLAQETMLAVWRRAAGFDPKRGTLSTWIFTIARNLRIDHLRRAAGRAPGAAVPCAMQLWNQGEDVPDAGPGPDEALLIAQRTLRLRRALSELTEDQALLLQLCFFEECTHATMATKLGIPLGTVKSRVRRAINRMRELLELE